MDNTTILYILYGIAVCLVAFGIWFSLNIGKTKGKNHDELRAEMETLRQQMKRRQNRTSPEEFKQTVNKFNQNAKRLRIPLYGEEYK